MLLLPHRCSTCKLAPFAFSKRSAWGQLSTRTAPSAQGSPFSAAGFRCVHAASSQVLNLLDPKLKVATFAKRWAQAVKHKNRDRQTDLIATGGCVKCPQTGRYVVAPKVDGRITCVGQQQQQEAREKQQQQEGAACEAIDCGGAPPSEEALRCDSSSK
jgi:hypothetical protein